MTLIKEYAGEDQQLDKAIETALQQIKDRKPLPEDPGSSHLQGSRTASDQVTDYQDTEI